MIDSLVAIERDLFLLLNGPHTPYLDGVMYLISDKWPWVIYAVLFLLTMTWKQAKGEVVLFILGMLLVIFLADGVSSGIFKPLVQRYRPTHHPLTEDTVRTVLDYRGGDFGFISGHAANFMALALFTSLVIKHRLYTILSFMVATTVAYSRIYLGVHFITDIIPGIIVGLLCGWVSYVIYRESRIAFLDLTKRESHQSYLKPQERKSVATVIQLGFYVLIWATAPFFIKYYS